MKNATLGNSVTKTLIKSKNKPNRNNGKNRNKNLRESVASYS